MVKQIFVDLPVADLKASIAFFARLGFTFNPQFTDDTATCMIVGDNIYAMLLTRECFAGFAPHPPADARAATEVLLALQLDAACHARASAAAETDWARIAALYDALAQVAPSPVVALNRAVAVGMAFGPAAGLEQVEALMSEPMLKDYHLLPAVRGDLLAKLDRVEEALPNSRAPRSWRRTRGSGLCCWRGPLGCGGTEAVSVSRPWSGRPTQRAWRAPA